MPNCSVMRIVAAAVLLPACLLVKPVTVRDPVVSLASIPATVGFDPLTITGEITDENAVFSGEASLVVDGAEVATQPIDGVTTPVSLSWTAPPNERDVIHVVGVRLESSSGSVVYDESVNVVVKTALDIGCAVTTINHVAACTSSHPVTWRFATGGTVNASGDVRPNTLGVLTLTATSTTRSDIVATTTLESVAAPLVPDITTPAIVTAEKPGYTASTTPAANLVFSWSAENLTLQATDGAIVGFIPAADAGPATLHVTATNAAGDSETTSKTIAIVAAPVVTASAAATTTINRPITASASVTPGLTYQWSATGGAITGGASTPTLSVTAPGAPATMTLTVTATNEAGDQASAQAIVTVELPRVDTVLGVANMSGDDDGGPIDARFNAPRGMVFTPDGVLWVVDHGNNALRRVDVPQGYVVTTVAGLALSAPEGITYHPSTGRLYLADQGNHCIRWLDPLDTTQRGTLAGECGTMGTTPNGTLASAARFTQPAEVAAAGTKGLYVAEYGANAVHRISLDAAPTVYTVIPSGPCSGSMNGTGGPSGTARIACPFALAFRSDGGLFVGQSGTARFMIDTNDPDQDTYALTTVHSGRFAQHAAIDRRGDMYLTANGDNTQHWVERWTYSTAQLTAHDAAGATVQNVLGNGTTGLATPPTLSGAFGSPHGIAVDPLSGDLFVSSLTAHIIVRLRQP